MPDLTDTCKAIIEAGEEVRAKPEPCLDLDTEARFIALATRHADELARAYLVQFDLLKDTLELANRAVNRAELATRQWERCNGLIQEAGDALEKHCYWHDQNGVGRCAKCGHEEPGHHEYCEVRAVLAKLGRE